MRIIYCIAGFYRPAGMERVLADKANWLSRHGYQVTIITTEQKGRPLAFPLDESVAIRDFGIGYEDNNGGSLWDKMIHYPSKQRKHLKELKRTVSEIAPDIVVSMFCNEVNLIPRLKDGSRKVLEVHFSRFKRLQYGRTGVWGLVNKCRSRRDAVLARKYDRFVVLTEEDALNWDVPGTLRVIQNPVNFRPSAPAPLDAKTVIAVGRYTYQKGLERLVEAWSIVSERFPDWTLRLVGDGEDRGQLESRIKALSLGNVVLGRFEGDMASVYRSASVLALPSRFEGLPMALIEAQAFGVPSVAYDCKCGPREIIEDGVSGILVSEGDIEGLAHAITGLIGDKEKLKNMGLAAFKASSRWNMDTIMRKWTNLFEEIS